MVAISPAFNFCKVTVWSGDTPEIGATPTCSIVTSLDISGVTKELKLPLTAIELGPDDLAVKVRMPLLLSATV